MAWGKELECKVEKKQGKRCNVYILLNTGIFILTLVFNIYVIFCFKNWSDNRHLEKPSAFISNPETFKWLRTLNFRVTDEK